MSLSGRCALVTGGSRGIGRAVALALGGAGAKVAVNYLNNQEAAEQTASQIRALGQDAMAVQADVRDLEQVKTMVAQIEERLGPLDILINNAGVLRDNLLVFMTNDEWDDVMDTGLKGAYHCIKIVGKLMARRRAGRIVNIGSDAGELGDMKRANYSSSKAGIVGLTKTAAREFAVSGIAVNAVIPGMIETDMIREMQSAKREKLLASIPFRRFGTPEEVAKAILFLLSDSADYITGHSLRVDGGMVM